MANTAFFIDDLYPLANHNQWIEIWDRERNETEIDSKDDRALAVAKVENGVIKKVIVVKSGRGYLDPVAIVRGGPPEDPGNHPVMKYPNGNRRYRIWRCINERETLFGEMEVCGHVEHCLEGIISSFQITNDVTHWIKPSNGPCFGFIVTVPLSRASIVLHLA